MHSQELGGAEDDRLCSWALSYGFVPGYSLPWLQEQAVLGERSALSSLCSRVLLSCSVPVTLSPIKH